MRIVGNGFIAAHLRAIARAHPGVVALAAGVSTTVVTDEAEFARELRLVEETAAECRRTGERLLVFSSASRAVYGDSAGREEESLTPVNSYGRHKRRVEQAVADSGCEWLVARLGHIVGPGQRPHQLVPVLVEQVRGGEVRLVRGASRDLLDVAHMLEALDGLLRSGVSRQTVNVASGVPADVAGIVDHIAARLRVRPRLLVQDAGPGGSGRHRVSVRRLHSLVPALARIPRDPGYPYRVVDRYLAARGLLAPPSDAGRRGAGRR